MSLLYVAFISFLPLTESRAAIPIGVALGLNPFLVFIVSFLSNLVVFPILLFFLENLHKNFLKIKIYNKFSVKILEKIRGKVKPYLKWSWLGLALFVALPLPGSGVYSATLATWFFGLKRKNAFYAIFLGLLFASTTILFASIGVFEIFKHFLILK